MKCKICDSNSRELFRGIVLNKYEVQYFVCENCGFVQTEDPYWIKDLYINSATSPAAAALSEMKDADGDRLTLANPDVGGVWRNLNAAAFAAILWYFFFDKNGKYVDYGGGYGLFTRLMRDIGFDCYLYEPFAPNIYADTFEYNPKDKIELVTAFECFEHFANPLEDITKIFSISKNLLLTTCFVASPPPRLEDWPYYIPAYGGHISFYTKKAMKIVAEKHGLNCYFCSPHLNFILFTEKKLNLRLFRKLMSNPVKYHFLQVILFEYVKSKLQGKMFETVPLYKKVREKSCCIGS